MLYCNTSGVPRTRPLFAPIGRIWRFCFAFFADFQKSISMDASAGFHPQLSTEPSRFVIAQLVENSSTNSRISAKLYLLGTENYNLYRVNRVWNVGR